MTRTKLMLADEIAVNFNAVAEKQYWQARVAGTRTSPEVNFNSRSSMVQITYKLADKEFYILFIRTDAAFGDFMASAYRSLSQVSTALKASGFPVTAPLEDGTGVLRIQYDPRAKAFTVRLADLGDAWPEAEPLPLKVPNRKSDGDT